MSKYLIQNKVTKFKSRNTQILLVFVGGILMGLAPAPVNAWYLAWIGLVPLWYFVVQSNKFWSQTLLLAFAWGCGYHGLALWWITGVHPMTWMGVPWLASISIAIACWLAITAWGATLVTTWSVAMSFFTRILERQKPQNHRLPFILLRVLVGVALWCTVEKLWSYSPLWWSSVAYTQSPNNLAILQLGKISGYTTVTAAIVGVNSLLAEAIILSKSKKITRGKKQLLFFVVPGALWLILHLIGWWIYQLPISERTENAIQVGIIQGNIPNEIKLYSAGLQKAIAGYTNGYNILADRGVDAVLTPEGAIPFFQRDLMRSSLVTAVQAKGVIAWIGAFGERQRSYSNSLFTITGDGNIFSRYDKVNQVPIGEYVPFEPLIGGIIERLSPLDEHQIAGKANQIFDTPLGRAIVGICYDSAYGRHFRRQARAGGEFIITASNNDHYSAAMPAQHHAQDVMRAIETDRWAARATNTGYSAIVNPRGRTLWISNLNQYAIYADTIYRRQTQTLYVRWGDWLTPTLLISSITGVSYWLFVFRRSAAQSKERPPIA